MIKYTKIIDHNNYLNGKFVTFDPDKPYIIIVGERAIGKSVYSKAMSNYNKDIQYYSVQQLSHVNREIRIKAINIIAIQNILDIGGIIWLNTLKLKAIRI